MNFTILDCSTFPAAQKMPTNFADPSERAYEMSYVNSLVTTSPSVLDNNNTNNNSNAAMMDAAWMSPSAPQDDGPDGIHGDGLIERQIREANSQQQHVRKKKGKAPVGADHHVVPPPPPPPPPLPGAAGLGTPQLAHPSGDATADTTNRHVLLMRAFKWEMAQALKRVCLRQAGGSNQTRQITHRFLFDYSNELSMELLHRLTLTFAPRENDVAAAADEALRERGLDEPVRRIVLEKAGFSPEIAAPTKGENAAVPKAPKSAAAATTKAQKPKKPPVVPFIGKPYVKRMVRKNHLEISIPNGRHLRDFFWTNPDVVDVADNCGGGTQTPLSWAIAHAERAITKEQVYAVLGVKPEHLPASAEDYALEFVVRGVMDDARSYRWGCKSSRGVIAHMWMPKGTMVSGIDEMCYDPVLRHFDEDFGRGYCCMQIKDTSLDMIERMQERNLAVKSYHKRKAAELEAENAADVDHPNEPRATFRPDQISMLTCYPNRIGHWHDHEMYDTSYHSGGGSVHTWQDPSDAGGDDTAAKPSTSSDQARQDNDEAAWTPATCEKRYNYFGEQQDLDEMRSALSLGRIGSFVRSQARRYRHGVMKQERDADGNVTKVEHYQCDDLRLIDLEHSNIYGDGDCNPQLARYAEITCDVELESIVPNPEDYLPPMDKLLKYRTIVKEPSSAAAASASSSAIPRFGRRRWEENNIHSETHEVQVKLEWAKCRSEIELEFVRRAPRSLIPAGKSCVVKGANHIPKYYI